MKIENVKLKDLKPLEKNVRKHSDKQIDELIRSIKQFGQTRAIVIDEDNNILIGNGLYMAFEKIGTEECQCYRITGLTEVQKKKLILTDNKVYSLGSDDYEGINNFIQEITVTGDFDIAGFDAEILKSMTMSFEENEEIMKDYGNIQDIKLTQEEPEAVNNPVDDNKKVIAAEEPKVIEREVQKSADERKYVICRNCGEVIYID